MSRSTGAGSIYGMCSVAARGLAAKPEIFTEIDIVIAASAGKHWNKALHKEAMRHANQIVSQQYRASKLVRFGPVTFKDKKDYARLASKIVYAGIEIDGDTKVPLISEWKTPNGVFKALFIGDDTLSRTGRLPGNNRDDSKDWAEQEVEETANVEETVEREKGSGPEVAQNPVKILNDQLETANRTIERLRAELSAENTAKDLQVRQVAGEIALDLVADIESILSQQIADLNDRTSRLEKIEEKRRRLYSVEAA